MRFLRFKVSNYKSFFESPELTFSPGINVIIGQNNSGKTALIEALSLRFGDLPHRSLETRPARTAPFSPHSLVQFIFEIGTSELSNIMRDHFQTAAVGADGQQAFETEAGRILHILNTNPAIRCSFRPSAGLTDYLFDAYPVGVSPHCVEVRVEPAAGAIVLSQRNFVGGVGVQQRLTSRLASMFHERIYVFKAERLNIGESAIGTDPVLAPNASNLPAVLHLLHASNPARFRRLESYVRDVFPQVRQITVPPVGGTARILLWAVEPDTERDDLAISLAESGTGIGQVLAILYVVVTAEYPRVILIDEPHSFLHPAAIRKLLDILMTHRMHQYIITTHSPIALTASSPDTLILLRMEGPRSTAIGIDPRETTDLRAVLAEVGARLSDVFGADNILWVEGRTEELCFPLIREKARQPGEPATGTVILAVRETGDFRGRDARATIEIYHRLTAGRHLMPPAVGFIFDPEVQSAREQEDLRRQSRGLVRFLARRMFENYLLIPEAISSVMNGIDGFRQEPVQPDEIRNWLAEHKWDAKYFKTPVAVNLQTEAEWLRSVDGAKVLAEVFSELSVRRVAYDKVTHGLRLTGWICDNRFENLRDISDLIRDVISGPVGRPR